SRGGVAVNDHQIMVMCELLNLVEVLLARPMLQLQLLVSQILPLSRRRLSQLLRLVSQGFGISNRAHTHGQTRDLGRVGRSSRSRVRQQRAPASRQRYLDCHDGTSV